RKGSGEDRDVRNIKRGHGKNRGVELTSAGDHARIAWSLRLLLGALSDAAIRLHDFRFRRIRLECAATVIESRHARRPVRVQSAEFAAPASRQGARHL